MRRIWSLISTQFESIDVLAKALRPVPDGIVADAAVALLFKRVNRDIEVLLVKRTESPSDPWSGNVALPGGKRISEDGDLKETIVRETLEETNINLLDCCRFLGVFETLTSDLRPDMKILPFVVLVEHEPMVKLNSELESFSWVSLKKLVGSRKKVRVSFGEVPAYAVDHIIVWGLTYRILEMFAKILSI